jgi:predicted acylesterase/phospholipase RssA
MPALAAGDVPDGPRRSLLLAGGGMRVAYQAGVLVALERAGLTFAHGDGASGGTINLAMLLSGLTPAQMCERWRALDVHGFVSLLPLRRLLRAPPYPALGSSEGIRDRVLPHLGVDPSRIRAAQGMVGTFNVCDYGRKLCIAVPNDEVDLDLLVAGVSLPVLSPAVRRDGRVLVDAVWIKDANVEEAVRRGADELWLVWAIGNHGVYRNGAFQQYVHMIEMSANGSLFGELRDVALLNTARQQPIRLHVIRPHVPLPLDPDFFLGRVDAATLIAMGHRDACEYLATSSPEGVALGPEATRMQDPRPGVGFRETLEGEIGGPACVRLGWEIDDLDAFARDGAGTLVGDFTHPALGERVLASGGEFVRDRRHWRGELRLGTARLELVREQRSWGTVHMRLIDNARGELGSGQLQVSGTPGWATLHARGVGSMAEGARAVARFAHTVLASTGSPAFRPARSATPQHAPADAVASD